MNSINDKTILIAGGYGVVGEQIARLLHQRHPDWHLIIAGRNIAKAQTLADQLGNATAMMLDMNQPQPLNGNKPHAILAAVNDPQDYLLMGAMRASIPYVDITRWTERLKLAASRAEDFKPTSTVMLASGWMAGVVAVIAAGSAKKLALVQSIDISVLFSLKDKAGPNSVEYMDRLATPFKVTINGEDQIVKPYTDPRKVIFPDNYKTRTYRFDTPDQLTLPETVNAKSVAARIAFDDAFTTSLLVTLVRSGIWKLISGKRFTSLRRSLLYNPGAGASHQVVIEIQGEDGKGRARRIHITIVDPLGQTHLTALGAIIQLERVLSLDNQAGVIYPDTNPDMESSLKLLQEFGVRVEIKG